jgi:hypothetical protein
MTNYDQFHDGSLDGFLIEGALVRVFVSTEQKQAFALEVRGVVAMTAEGFRAGNIIFEVTVRRADELALEDVIQTYGLQPSAAGETQARELLDKAKEKGLSLLEINPSYGGQCLVLAQSVELAPRAELGNGAKNSGLT